MYARINNPNVYAGTGISYMQPGFPLPPPPTMGREGVFIILPPHPPTRWAGHPEKILGHFTPHPPTQISELKTFRENIQKSSVFEKWAGQALNGGHAHPFCIGLSWNSISKICWKFHSKIFIHLKVQNHQFLKNGSKNLTKVKNFKLSLIVGNDFIGIFNGIVAGLKWTRNPGFSIPGLF